MTPSKAPFDGKLLAKFYALISVEKGVRTSTFQKHFSALFVRYRSDADLNAYRLGKGPWKKLADEVSPLSRFLRWRGISAGRVRFPLNDRAPDCWLWQGAERVGVEVTIALGRERYHLAKELIEKPFGRGFVGIQDDAPQASFDAAMAKGRVLHSIPQALTAIKKGILRCLQKKNKTQFEGFILLIQAPLSCLPRERWNAIVPALRSSAAALPFSAIYVIGNGDERPF